MVHGLILTDNLFCDQFEWVSRGSGAHRIASYLREHNYKIEVIDFCVRWTPDEFMRLCEKVIGPDTLFLGIGSNLFHDSDNVNLLTDRFKEVYPNIPIVVGGNNLLGRKFRNVDYYIEGYAETATLVLLDYLRGKITRDDIKWHPFSPKLIDGIHDYAYNDTSDLSIRYLPTDFIKPAEFLGIETGRGCIFKCKFCPMPLIGKKKLDYLRDMMTLVDEFQQNYDDFGTTNYIINEDTFNDTVDKLEFLAEAVSKLSFQPQMVCFARLDLIVARPETIDLFRRIGIRGVHFGIETFNRRAGKIIGKGMDPEKVKQGLIWFKEQMPEVTVHCTMIVGLPGDTLEDSIAAQQWYDQSPVDCWNFSPLAIAKTDKHLHSSEFSKDYEKYGFVPMTEAEIEAELEIERQDPNVAFSARFTQYLNPEFREKIIFWKNKELGMNYLSASREALKLNTSSRRRKISSWSLSAWSALGYSIEEMQTWGYYDHKPNVPTEELLDKANKFVAEYIKDKINFDYQEFYGKKTDPIKSNKIIQIKPTLIESVNLDTIEYKKEAVNS